MFRKQFLAFVIVLTAAIPAFSKPAVIGSVLSSQGATVRGTSLKAGLTIFSGDTIEVGPGGSALISLPNGGQVQVASDSQVSLIKNADAVEMTINRGQATAAGKVTVINHAPPVPAKDNSYNGGDNNKGKGDHNGDDDDCDVSPHHKKHKGDKGYSDSHDKDSKDKGYSDSHDHDHCHDH